MAKVLSTISRQFGPRPAAMAEMSATSIVGLAGVSTQIMSASAPAARIASVSVPLTVRT